jgi:large repetitive protein
MKTKYFFFLLLFLVVNAVLGANPVPADDTVTFTVANQNTTKTFNPRGNDSPRNGTIDSFTQPGKGSVSRVNNNRKFKYTPDINSVPYTTTFTYKIVKNGDVSNTSATVTMVVNGPDFPTAPNFNKTMTIPAESYVEADVYSVDGFKVKNVVNAPSDGSTSYKPNNNNRERIRYTPDNDFIGTDSFTYITKDTLNRESVAGTVTITVSGPALPVATDDTDYVIGATRNVDVSVLDNDTVSGTNTVEVVGQPSNGTTSLQDNSTVIRYRRNANFTSGTDTFTYKILDAYSQESGTATVTIIVSEEPIGNDDYAAMGANDNWKNISVLNNDLPSGATVYTITQPSHGTSQIRNNNRKVRYTPTAGYTGEDQFTYTVKIGSGQNMEVSESATVYIYRGEFPQFAAVNDSVETDVETPVTINVLGNDTGAFKIITNVGTPSNGTAVISNAKIVYTPNDGFEGSDKFNYTIQNGFNETSTGEVTVTVSSAGCEANDDMVIVPQNTSTIINVLGNDTGVAPLTIQSVTTPAAGGTAVIENNKIKYTGKTDSIQNDSFNYTMLDDNGATDEATVTIIIDTLEIPKAVMDATDNVANNEYTDGNGAPLVFSQNDIGNDDFIPTIDLLTYQRLYSNYSVNDQNSNEEKLHFAETASKFETLYGLRVDIENGDIADTTISDFNSGLSTLVSTHLIPEE